MKKTIQRLFALCLVLAMTASLSVASFATTYKKIRLVSKVNETFLYTQEAHPLNGNGPISITEGTLTRDGKTKEIYLVALHGTEITALGSSVDLIADLQSGTGKESVYMREIMAIMKQYIPKNANVIFAGHSLGGMVAQQIAAEKDMQKRYHILNIVTFGSPVLCMGETEGELHRMCDTNDMVPYLSTETVDDMDAQQTYCREEETWPGDEEHDTGDAHPFSYADEDTWGDYDAIGKKGGDAVLTMDDATTIYFDAPAIEGNETHLKVWVCYPDGTNWKGISILL